MKRYIGASAVEMGICVVVFLSAISLLVVVFNPSRKIEQKRNEIRTESVNSISNAISRYISDNGSGIITTIPTSDSCKGIDNEICKTSAASCDGYVDLSDITDSGKYIANIPVDPNNRSQLGTGYHVVKNSSGVVTVCAPLAEQGIDISLSK